MKRYIFFVCLLFLTLITAYPSIKDIEFINREYILDSKYLPQLIKFSLEHNIRMETLHNWIMAESSGRERAYNRKSGDKGLCQLHDVKYLVRKYWTLTGPFTGPFNVYDGEHNLFIALAYLGDLIDTFGIYHGFMAYNIGRGRIARGEILNCGIKYVSSILPGETQPVTIRYPLIYRYSILTFQEQVLFDRRERYV